MFFAASKLLAFLTSPSNLLIVLIVIGTLLLFTRWIRLARRLLVLATVVILTIGLTPVGSVLLRVLEDRFPAWDPSRGAPTGFIILGGAVDPELSAARHATALGGSAERLTAVAELARRYPAAKFIYSSGSGALFGGLAEADYVLPLFESFAIPTSRITLERDSRNTFENATFSKALAAPKPGERWVIVTSAAHMPRAIGAFRAAGFDVEAYPVDWLTGGDSTAILPSFLSGLAATDAAAHEFIGLVAYRLSGRSAEFFPAPR